MILQKKEKEGDFRSQLINKNLWAERSQNYARDRIEFRRKSSFRKGVRWADLLGEGV